MQSACISSHLEFKKNLSVDGRFRTHYIWLKEPARSHVYPALLAVFFGAEGGHIITMYYEAK